MRVGAIHSGTTTEVKFFGYGEYLGDEIPPPGIQMMGIELHELKTPNPKITLDSGKVVWGCECWWGPEEKIKETLKGKKIIEVDIEEERRKNNEK